MKDILLKKSKLLKSKLVLVNFYSIFFSNYFFFYREIKVALDYLGFDPNSEIPIITKIKEDVKKFNDKNQIINRIKELEDQAHFAIDKKHFIWLENENEKEKSDKCVKAFYYGGKTSAKSRHNSSRSRRSRSLSFNSGQTVPVFEPSTMRILNDKSKHFDMHDSIELINKYLIQNNYIIKII